MEAGSKIRRSINLQASLMVSGGIRRRRCDEPCRRPIKAERGLANTTPYFDHTMPRPLFQRPHSRVPWSLVGLSLESVVSSGLLILPSPRTLPSTTELIGTTVLISSNLLAFVKLFNWEVANIILIRPFRLIAQSKCVRCTFDLSLGSAGRHSSAHNRRLGFPATSSNSTISKLIIPISVSA